jgi:GH24 family phage-related lysozyme (muramidase)
VLVEGSSVSDPHAVQYTSTSAADCLNACTQNQLPTGQTAACLSTNYNRATNLCTLNTDTMPPEGEHTHASTVNA